MIGWTDLEGKERKKKGGRGLKKALIGSLQGSEKGELWRDKKGKKNYSYIYAPK
jgi:hypothetical protein